jgi:hypothetical protein
MLEIYEIKTMLVIVSLMSYKNEEKRTFVRFWKLTSLTNVIH